MPGYAPLHLSRVDVLGRRLDEPGLGTDEGDRAVLLPAAQVVGVVPPAALADGTEVGPGVVSRHHRRASGHDLAHLARGHLAAIGIDDAHLHHWRGATGVALGRAPESVEGQHPHDLGLPVAGWLAGPGARVTRDHVVPLR